MSPTRPHPARDFILAVSTLTLVPVRVDWPSRESTDAPGYYPLVGAGLGAVAWSAAWLSHTLGWSDSAPLLIGAAIVALFALLTRMLHWDGLADVADSFGVQGRERRLAVMKDSATGAFGVTTLALAVVLQAAAISRLLNGRAAFALVAVPILGRVSAAFAAWFGKAARTDGLGASVVGRPRIGALLPAGLTLLALLCGTLFVLDLTAVWLLAAGVAFALAVPHLLARRLGGVTGDVMGASVVVVETILFAAFALML